MDLTTSNCKCAVVFHSLIENLDHGKKLLNSQKWKADESAHQGSRPVHHNRKWLCGRCICSVSLEWAECISLTETPEHVARLPLEGVFPREGEDGICCTPFCLGSLDPICAYLDSVFTSIHTKIKALHAATELISCFQDKEILDSLLPQRPRSNYPRDTASKDKDFGIMLALVVIVSGNGVACDDGRNSKEDKQMRRPHA